ncbi:MAG: glycoside hydrolase family 13 protein [Woeseiaceae bacterium]
MTKYSILAISIIFLATCGNASETETLDGIERVEPPFWWQGFKHTELQLLVHGDGIASLSPAIDYPGVSVERIEKGDSPNYLFIYLDISATAKPGTFDIVLNGKDRSLSYEYELRERRAGAAEVKGFSPADVIYLITPDRFANGDPANDSVDGYTDKHDRSDDYGRHGGDIAGIRQNLDYISDMGFTAIWLNPVLENAMPRASYHGYATTDFYAVDPRLGSNESYRELVTAARDKGIGTIMDMIVNHAGSQHWWKDDLPTSDWYNVPDERTVTSHARTSIQDPYASDYDKRVFADGWFSDSMPDLNQQNPLLADYLTQNAIWWTEYLGLAGIRMDTYSYPDKQFMSNWTRRIVDEYPGINIVGEEWSTSPTIVSYWQRGKENHDGYKSWLPSVMDFPLQEALIESLMQAPKDWGSVWTPVYEMLGHDFLYPDPSNLVIFPDNHDMSRIYTQLNEDDQLFRMAMVFYLTMRGIPQIYYGTEILMSHPGTDSHGAIREDFPGGWPSDERNAFSGKGLSRKQREAQQFLRTLLNWRKGAEVIHSGSLMQYSPMRDVYAYFRYDNDDTVMVVFNRGEDGVDLDLARFSERLQDADSAIDILSGDTYDLRSSLSLEPRSVLLLEVEDR